MRSLQNSLFFPIEAISYVLARSENALTLCVVVGVVLNREYIQGVLQD